MKHKYKEEIEKANKSLQRVMGSQMPLHIKEKMMDSIRENLTTNMKCLIEINKETKDMILNLEKINNYSTHINLIQKWKEAQRISKNPSTTSTNWNSSALQSIDYKNFNGENTSKNAQSFWSTHSVTEETEEQKQIDEIKQEKAKLEEVIASLKQTRNFLVVSIENSQDDVMEFQAFVHEKKLSLEGKLKQIEELKRKFSTESLKRSASMLLANKTRTGTETDRTERSISRVNTTVFQEVSSRVTGLLGKVFGRKNQEPTITDKVLSTEFLNDLNLQTLPNTSGSPRESVNRRDNFRPSTTRTYKR